MSKIIRVTFLFIILVFISCSEITENEPIIEIIDCSSISELNVTEKDSIVFTKDDDPIIWNGFFTKNQIKLSYNVPIGASGENETYSFILNKTESCLAISNAFKYYDGASVDISAVTEVNFKQLFIQEWREDEFFSGEIVYEDPHDKLTYMRKVWVNLKEDNNLPLTLINFTNCLGSKLPLTIDIDKDGDNDFELTFETTRDIGNTPAFNKHVILLKSTNSDINQILSPIKSRPPYLVLFEAPFSSENTRQYFNGVKTELDIFYEFENPYEEFNFFVSNRLTYFDKLNNNAKDYFLIRLIRDNKEYFGWINFVLDVNNCSVDVIETFLSESANTPIFVN